MEFTLLGAVLLAYGATTLTVKRLQPSDAPKVADVLLGATIVGLAVGRVWYMLGTNTNPLTHLGDFILIRAGVSTIGATLGFVGVLLWKFKKNAAFGAALVAVPALVGLAGWELGCLVRGTCLGTESSIGLTSVAGVIRHPIGVYTGILFLASALTVWRMQQKGLPAWTGPLAFALAALTRAATEPLRLHFGDGLLWWYLSAFAVGMLGAAVLRRQQLPIQQYPSTS